MIDGMLEWARSDRPARIVPVVAVAGAMALFALAYAQFRLTGTTHRPLLGGSFGVVLVIVAAAFAGRRLAARFASRFPAPGRLDPLWGSSLALTGLVGAIGLTLVGALALRAPPLEASVFKAWDYMDKRWVVELFLLGAGLVYLPGLFHRLISPAETPGPAPSPATAFNGRRALLAVIAGSILALLYVAPLLPGAVDRYLDAHEQVHLGTFQRIAQGATPYLDARTQYGPGQQMVQYRMMKSSEFTLRGFRLSQAWLDIVAIAALISIWFFAYGARIGTAVLVAALAVSPLLIITFWGWGYLFRWFGPILIGTIAPLILWRKVTPRVQIATVFGLGAICGVLAWMAQENLTGSIIAMSLLLGAAVIRGVVTFRTAILLALLFAVSEIAVLLGAMISSFGPGHLREAMGLYFLSTGLVFQGMTNTAWSDPYSTWRRAYRITPALIILLTAFTLYFRRPRPGEPDDALHVGQILGLVAAAVPLTMLTLFRADPPHFVGPSMALAPLAILSLAYLPPRFKWALDGGNFVRLAMVAGMMIFFFNPKGNWQTRVGNDRTFSDPRRIGNMSYMMDGLRLLRAGTPFARPLAFQPDPVIGKLGFTPDMTSHCCHIGEMSFGEWHDTLLGIHRIAAGRPVFVDVALPFESSGIYFLADLNVGTPFVSRIMSLWTDDDVRTVRASLARRPPACIVADDSGMIVTRGLIASHPGYRPQPLPGNAGLTIWCLPDNRVSKAGM